MQLFFIFTEQPNHRACFNSTEHQNERRAPPRPLWQMHTVSNQVDRLYYEVRDKRASTGKPIVSRHCYLFSMLTSSHVYR